MRGARQTVMAAIGGLALAVTLAVNAKGAEPLHTVDGRHAIAKIELVAVYFVPRDRTPLPDWRERVSYYCRRIEQFHQREFDGRSVLHATVYPEPLISEKDSSELRSGDRDSIFFQTMGETARRLGFGPCKSGAFPILLVLSDINWRELDDFTRLRAMDGRFEGQILDGRHFPGAESGGARATYVADPGFGWGLVSGDGWRVPYSGCDAVVYHEGVGHAIGLPHPESQNGSVMSLAQYQFWLSQSWIDDDQKRQLGWTPPEKPVPRTDLYSTFTAIPEPLVPAPGEPVALRCVWPDEAQVKHFRVATQTALFGPWLDVPQSPGEQPPATVALGTFDRPTSVSYRVEAALENGQSVELWGYFQVRSAPDAAPAAIGSPSDPGGPPPARWEETVDLLALVDPSRDWKKGEWTREAGRLTSGKQFGARIEIPYCPPEEYVMTAVVEPLDAPHGLILGQRSGENRFLALIHYPADDRAASALENVDGRNVASGGTTFRGPLLETGRVSTIVCTVRTARVTVTCDSRPVIDWSGDRARLSLSDYWQTPDARALFVGAYDCRLRFHRLTLTPVSGQGTNRRASPQ